MFEWYKILNKLKRKQKAEIGQYNSNLMRLKVYYFKHFFDYPTIQGNEDDYLEKFIYIITISFKDNKI